MNIQQLYQKASLLPLEPGCYIMRDARHTILYIGKAKKLRLRVQSYFRDGAAHDPKVERLISLVNDFDIIVTDSEFEALVLECSLIKQHAPKYNIMLKDDKGFSYIRVSDEDYPRIAVVLQKSQDSARYIGPYIGSFAIRQLVERATFAFGLPTCSRRFPQDFGRGRPCLNAHIGKCAAICTGKISREDYLKTVEDAVTYITRGSKDIIRQLQGEMQQASDALEFERAARIRDSIAAINKADAGQKVIRSGSDLAQDVFAFAASGRSICAVVLKFREGRLCDKDEQLIYDTTSIEEIREEFITHYYISSRDIPKRILIDEDFETRELVEQWLSTQKQQTVSVMKPQRGDNAALVVMAYNNAAERLSREAGHRDRDGVALGELANLLGLSEIPKTIEAYDISNYGNNAVGGMVVFQDGKPRRRDYRRFIIKEVLGVDDYASMQEVVSRRIARYDEGGQNSFARMPDIILLDGGRGHLSSVLEVMRGTSFEEVPVYGMVKDDKHRTRGIVSKQGELSVALFKSAFALVTKIQDETHRFTLEYQRQRHTQNTFHSSLTKIEGVGEKRAKQLLAHFKTIDAIKKATVDELAEVEGMPERTAQQVYDHYHPAP